MTMLSHGAKMGTLYQHQIGCFRHIQQKYLRAMLRIRYQAHVMNDQVLELANMQNVKVTLCKM